MAEPLYIVIAGCGRLGRMLAQRLSVAGHEVVVIDSNPEVFEQLSQDFSGFTIVGDAREREILRQAEVSRANYCFAITAEDNINLMLAQVARHIFDVKEVIARVYDPPREHIFREFGIKTISPTELAASAFIDLVHHSAKDADGA